MSGTNPVTPVTISVDGDFVIVTCPALLGDRSARMFFNSILGAQVTQEGWRCPRRKFTISSLVVRINTFLESKGWTVVRVGVADESVQRELERRRSFQRTKESAAAFRSGDHQLQAQAVADTLTRFGWNTEARNLREHQRAGLLHSLTAINAANFSVPGSGKTATTLAAAATHVATGTIDIVVVVGPLSCFRPWEDEVRIATPRVLTAKRIRGTASQRKGAYRAVRPRDVVLVSYATAAADRLVLLELFRQYRVMLVVDESHRVKRFRGGTWAPALLELAGRARIRSVLSGTPMPQSGRDLYTQLNILWPGGELTGPRDLFASRVEKDFTSILKDIKPFISRTPKEALGLPPYTIQTHEVQLTGLQAEIYTLIEGGLRRRLEDTPNWRDKLDALRRAKPIRLLQAAANPDTLNSVDSYYRLPRIQNANPTLMERLADYARLETPAKSLAGLRLIEQIAGRGEKVVCWSNFVRNLDQFTRLVTTELGVRSFQIDGRVPAGDETEDDSSDAPRINPEDTDTRERIIEQFLALDRPAVLITNPASCSESISLHRSCHNAIYLDRTYDCSLFLQSIDRIHRLGLSPDAKVEVHLLIASIDGRATIDTLVHQALLRKENRMRQLLEGAELLPFNLQVDPLEAAQGDEEDLGNLLRYLLGENA